MKVNFNNNINFRAISRYAACESLKKYKESQTDINDVLNLMQEQSKNQRFHVDYQDGLYVVCDAQIKSSRLDGNISRKDTSFNQIPYTKRFNNIFEAAKLADELEQNTPHKDKDSITSNLLNYTI